MASPVTRVKRQFGDLSSCGLTSLDTLHRTPYSHLEFPCHPSRRGTSASAVAGESLKHKDLAMDSRTYKLIEIVGVSEESYAAATKNAIDRASQTLKGLGWFEVTELRGLIQDGKVSEYQVTLKVGFRLLDAADL